MNEIMEFQNLVKSVVENVLGKNERGRFRTVGYQRQDTDAQENLGLDRSVQVFYAGGAFPKSAGRARGTTMHDVTLRLELTVALEPEGDTQTITDENATESEIIAGLKAFQNSSQEADRLLDELWAIVYQILMDANNVNMGLLPPDDQPSAQMVANRWVDGFQKDDPIEQGGAMILTGKALLTARVAEAIIGVEGVTATEGVSTSLGINEDPVQQTGLQVK